MNDILIAASGCLVLGIMTTMHPCPLAANIAAISFLSGTAGSRGRQIRVITMFSLGYAFALVGIAIIINYGLVSVPRLSLYLQSVFSAFLGPMLIFVGMVLTGMIRIGGLYKNIIPEKQHWAGKPEIYIFLLGALLAVTFCPATAFIYFGILIPLSVDNGQLVLFPLLFSAGALLPIIVIAVLIKHGLIVRLQERWARNIPMIAGWLLILTGIYITLEQLYF